MEQELKRGLKSRNWLIALKHVKTNIPYKSHLCTLVFPALSNGLELYGKFQGKSRGKETTLEQDVTKTTMYIITWPRVYSNVAARTKFLDTKDFSFTLFS